VVRDRDHLVPHHTKAIVTQRYMTICDVRLFESHIPHIRTVIMSHVHAFTKVVRERDHLVPHQTKAIVTQRSLFEFYE